MQNSVTTLCYDNSVIPICSLFSKVLVLLFTRGWHHKNEDSSRAVIRGLATFHRRLRSVFAKNFGKSGENSAPGRGLGVADPVGGAGRGGSGISEAAADVGENSRNSRPQVVCGLKAVPHRTRLDATGSLTSGRLDLFIIISTFLALINILSLPRLCVVSCRQFDVVSFDALRAVWGSLAVLAVLTVLAILTVFQCELF